MATALNGESPLCGISSCFNNPHDDRRAQKIFNDIKIYFGAFSQNFSGSNYVQQ